MKNYILFLIVLSICPFVAGSQQYNIIRQGVCWTTPTAVDSSLTRLVYVSVSGAGPISVNYVNAGGVSVDVSSGGTFEMGYCGCCAPPVDSTAIDVLYYTDGDSILDRDTILYKNYYSHAFLSGNGNNFTGRIGNFNRPFLSPWEVQDLYPDSNNLQFVGYRGDYSYSGAGVGNALTRADTFTLFDLSASNYSMLSVTGALTAPFITDRTGAANVSTAKTINIFAPASNFLFSDSGIATSWILGVYNPNTYATIRAKSLSNTDASGRAWGVQVASKFFRLDVDTMRTAAQIGLHVADDISTPAAIRLTRDISMKVGFFYAGAGNTSDYRGLVRYQPALVTDSLTTIQIEIGAAQVQTTGLFAHYITTGRYVNSTASYYCKSYQTRGSADAGYMLSMSSPNAASFASGKVVFRVDDAQTHNGIFSTGSDSYPAGTNNLDASGNSRITIDLGQITTTSNFRGAIELQNITLQDSAQIVLECDLCRFEGSAIPIRITNCVFPEGTKFIIRGNYEFNRGNELIFITGTNDLTGLEFQDAVFINNGVAEWIEAAAPTVITGASGAWSNSPTTVNVEIQGSELWGFYNCDADYVPLQEILDAFCDSIAAVPADLNVAEDDLTANGSHVTDWLTHSITFDYTGALGDTLVYRWPSPDGEVQGLYITDGPQEMELLMNGIVGTDYHDLVNYDLAGEIVFGNTGDTTVTQADKWFADIQNLVRADTVRSVMAIDSDNEIKLKYVPISGRVSDTTDGSGDIVIPLGVTMSSVNFTALVGARGTLFQQAQVIANTATQITVRVLDDAGAPITGAAVVVDWMVMDY